MRRALAPVRLILRAAGAEVRVVAANDTRQDVALRLDCGYVGFDGRTAALRRLRATARAAARTEVARFPRGPHDPAAGLWIARPVGRSPVQPASLHALDYRRLRPVPAQVAARVLDSGTVEVRSRTYAHAVHLELPAGAVPADDYFDLLPGDVRRIKVRCARPLPANRVRVRAVNE